MWWQGFLTFLFSGSLNYLKQIWLFSAGSWSLFSTSLSSVIDCCGNVRHIALPHFNVLFKNFSTQILPRFIFNGSSTSPSANTLCTHHRDSACMLIFSVYGVLPLLLEEVRHLFSLFDSSSLYSVHHLALRYLQSLCIA